MRNSPLQRAAAAETGRRNATHGEARHGEQSPEYRIALSEKRLTGRYTLAHMLARRAGEGGSKA